MKHSSYAIAGIIAFVAVTATGWLVNGIIGAMVAWMISEGLLIALIVIMFMLGYGPGGRRDTPVN